MSQGECPHFEVSDLFEDPDDGEVLYDHSELRCIFCGRVRKNPGYSLNADLAWADVMGNWIENGEVPGG